MYPSCLQFFEIKEDQVILSPTELVSLCSMKKIQDFAWKFGDDKIGGIK